MLIDGYILGWLLIFICLLTVIHILSKYTREIFLWTIKISIALTITMWLVLAVYIVEHIDLALFSQSMDRIYEKIQELKDLKPGL